MVPHPHVRVDPTVLGGSPHVAGSRVPVRRLWAWHRGGASVETLVKRYPLLGPAKVMDALAFAYDNRALITADLEQEHAFFKEQSEARAFAEAEHQVESMNRGAEERLQTRPRDDGEL